jgi:methanogenic corrinoid protein MtbC1
MSGDYVNLLADLKEDEVLKLTKSRLDANEDPMKILEDSRKGMEVVGKRFADGEYFLPELVFSGELLKEITEMVKPHLKSDAKTKRLGKVVIGTVAGDIHDIGLNIVDFMLDVNGFEVTNLGVDVSAEKFVKAVQDTKAPIGGGQMDEEVRKYAKADAYGKDAMAAVSLAKEWIGVN